MVAVMISEVEITSIIVSNRIWTICIVLILIVIFVSVIVLTVITLIISIVLIVIVLISLVVSTMLTMLIISILTATTSHSRVWTHRIKLRIDVHIVVIVQMIGQILIGI